MKLLFILFIMHVYVLPIFAIYFIYSGIAICVQSVYVLRSPSMYHGGQNCHSGAEYNSDAKEYFRDCQGLISIHFFSFIYSVVQSACPSHVPSGYLTPRKNNRQRIPRFAPSEL